MRRADIAAVAAPAAVAGALCLPGLTSRSLSLDESATLSIASQHGSALGAAIAHDGGNMSGYYALMHVLVATFGHGLVVLRAPTVIATVITVALLARLGVMLFDRRVGASAGVLGAVSLPMVFWAQTARGDAPMMMLVTGSFVALIATLEDRGGRRGPPAAYALLIALSVYMGLLAALVIPAQLLLVRWHPGRRRGVLAAMAAAVAACVPLAVLAAQRGTGQLSWVAAPTPHAGLQLLDELSSGGLPPNFHTTPLTTATLALTLIALVSATMVSVRGWPRGLGLRPRHWQGAVAPLWLGVPIAVVIIESVAGQPMLVARNLLVALPAVALLLGWAIWRLGRRAAWPLLVALLALRLAVVVPAYGTSPENWRAATAYVLARATPGSCIAFYPADARMPFRFYLRGDRRPPRAVLPAVPWSDGRVFVEDYATLAANRLAALPARCRQLWLVAGHAGRPVGSTTSRVHYARYVALRRALGRLYRFRGQASFGYAPAVVVDQFKAASSSPRRSAR